MALPFLARVINTSASSSPGTVQYTYPGFGTVVGAIIIATNAIADNAINNGWVQSWGVTDGTHHRGCYSNSRHNVATGVSKASGTNDSTLLRIYNPALNTIVAEADFSAFVTDGIELNWAVEAPLGQNYQIAIILFGGSGCQCFVTDAVPPATTGATTVTPGFAADVVFTHTMATTDGSQANQADHGPGFSFKNAGSPANYGIQVLNDRGTTSESRTVAFNTDLGETITVGSTDTVTGISRINNYTSTTFDLVNSNSLQGPRFAMLAVKVGGVGVAVHEDVCPTSTGNVAYTFPGFKTGFLYALVTNNTAVGSKDGAEGGIGVSDMRGDDSCSTVYAKDNVSTSKTSSYRSSSALKVLDVDHTVIYTAGFVSIDPTGHTLNFSTAPASGRKFFSLVIEEVYLAATGTSAGATAVSGTLLGAGALVGSSAGATAVSGTLKGAGALTGNSAGATAAAGTLLGSGALSGSAAGLTSASGVLTGSGALQASAAGATAASGVLVGQGAESGATAGATVASGTLLGAGALSGSAAGATAASGSLTGLVFLTGTSAGATSATATLRGDGALAGASSGLTIAHATFTVKNPNCPTELDAGYDEVTELEAGWSLSSDLDAGYNRVGNLEGTTC